jgi:DNA-binding NtrC family response regulator
VARVLCIQSEPAVAALIEDTLQRSGHELRLASRLGDALAALADAPCDVVISDFRLPDGTGFDLLRRLREEDRAVPVVLLTADPSIEHAVLALRHGASDYLPKPVDAGALRRAVDEAVGAGRTHRGRGDARTSAADAARPRAIVGGSRVLGDALEMLDTVAATRASVLIEGESGTGKELFARAIHDRSPRRNQPFVTVNCAALPEGLVESTMFGHERGSFTGATGRSPGIFERAHRGTLLLDEISEMRLDLQAKLLRAIQEQEIERVGGQQPVPVDVRIIATTNRDLETEVAAGRFRGDLFYRLNVITLRTPALRERPEDVPVLAEHFVRRAAEEIGVDAPLVEREAAEFLASRRWPGNVRELQNAIARAVILCRDGRITSRSFGADAGGGPRAAAAPLPERPRLAPVIPLPRPAALPSPEPPHAPASFDLDTLEKTTIRSALAATNGHRARAAELLGISQRTLRNKLNGPERLCA